MYVSRFQDLHVRNSLVTRMCRMFTHVCVTVSGPKCAAQLELPELGCLPMYMSRFPGLHVRNSYSNQNLANFHLCMCHGVRSYMCGTV